MIRNCSASEASPPPTNTYSKARPEKPPPWEQGGSVTKELFGILMAPWIVFTMVLGYDQIRRLKKIATGPGRGIGRLWNLLPEHESLALQRFNKRTASIVDPICFAADLFSLITLIVLWQKGKKSKKKNFSEYYYAHAQEDNTQKEWMKDIYTAPTAMQALSLSFWIGANGLAQAMAENNKQVGKISFRLFSESVEDMTKIIEHQAKIVETIKKKGADHPDVLRIAKVIQSEFDKICQVRAHFNNSTKSVSSVIADDSLTHKKAMDQINDLLRFQAHTVKELRDGATDSVTYWLKKYIDKGPQESKKQREHIAIAFKNNIDNYSQWMALRPQDNEARFFASKFMRLAAFGTAEDVWKNAASLYHACEKMSPAAAMMLPNYNNAMDLWTQRYPTRADENYNAHGFRYPPKLIE